MSSINAQEINTFSQTSQHWWDETGPFKPLHRMNPTRVAYIRDQIATHFGRNPMASSPLQDLKIIDIGCGGGLLCEPLSRLGANMTGIDADHQAITVASAHAQTMNLDITYRQAAVEDLIHEPERYDAVLILEIIEHVDNVPEFVQACASLLKDKGILVFSTLNRTILSYIGGIIAAEQILRWVPPGTHDWDKFLKPSELSHYLTQANLRIRHLQGISYNFSTGTWALTNNTSINYIGIATA